MAIRIAYRETDRQNIILAKPGLGLGSEIYNATSVQFILSERKNFDEYQISIRANAALAGILDYLFPLKNFCMPKFS